MDPRSAKRLQRMIRLTEHLYEREARTAKELVDALDEVISTETVTRGYLESDALVGSAFPDLVMTRAVALQKRAGSLRKMADEQIEAAAVARGRVKGLEGRLRTALVEAEQERRASMLDEAIDQYLRRKPTSLP